MTEETASVDERRPSDTSLKKSPQEAPVLRTENRPRTHSTSSNISMVQETASVEASVDERRPSDASLKKSPQEAPVLRTGNRPRTRSTSSDISMVQETASVDERRSSDASLKERPQKAAEQEQEKTTDKDVTSKESSSHPYLDRMKEKFKNGAERVLTAFDKRLVKPFNDTFDKHVKEPLEPVLKPIARVLKPVAALFKTIAKALAVAMVLAAKLLNEIRKIGQEIAVNAWNLLAPHLFATREVILKVMRPIAKLFQKKKKDPADSSTDGEQANNDKSNKENETQDNNPSGRNETAETYVLAQQAAQQGRQHS
ncbi:hypothetical protein [Herbaspirillum sp. ST 5-3]|uniref:hypothetical protein n=1 Tax=Oxalobacteraceae TaxID=75682 RepID=UPI0010A47D90|nr:hypothetical protein [Herbaspirillum sp. ST 5-3]